MNKYKHLSGNAKRKRKQEEEAKKKKMPKVTDFFSAKASEIDLESIGVASACSSSTSTTFAAESNSNKLNFEEVQEKSKPLDLQEELKVSQTQICQQFHSNGVLTTNETNRTDRINFANKITDNDRQFIVTYGPCQPIFKDFPINAEGRSFSAVYYFQKSKSGIQYKRNWLCYSKSLDVAYCEPCWLFVDRVSNKTNESWIEGYKDWRHISQAIKRHESTNSHIVACQMYNKLIKNYLRSSTLQDRMSSLSLLSIENNVARSLEVDKIVTHFAQAKARKVLV